MASHEKPEELSGLLTDIEGATEVHHVHDNNYQSPSANSTHGRRTLWWLILSASMAANVVFSVLLLHPLQKIEPSSRFAGLQCTREEPYVLVTQYSSDNEKLQDGLWHDINVDNGVVALSDEWAAQHGLRTAQRFPWDRKKGIYILHGFHNLHCLKIIHISLSEYRRGTRQSRSWHHVSHCMDALRRQVLCDADDTPRATERRAEVVSGLLQHRKCRSWEKLEDFAKRHTACYRRPDNPDSEGISKLERFKHCPPDSGYVVTDDYVPTDELMVGLPEESLGEDVV